MKFNFSTYQSLCIINFKLPYAVFRMLVSTAFSIMLLILATHTSAQNKNYTLEILPVDTNAKTELQNKKRFFKIKDSADVGKKLAKIVGKWHQKAYPLANIDSVVYNTDNIQAFLFLGNKYHYINILSSNIDYGVLKKAGIKNHRLYNKRLSFEDFTRLRKKIINYLENTGYPFAQISMDSMVFNTKGITTVLNLQKNTLIKIDSIVYKGKTKISSKYLNHYISIRKGDLYNQSKIDNISRDLDKLPYINIAKYPEIEFRDNKADVYLYLTNKKSNYFNGIVGFVSDENKKLKLNGDLTVSLNNNFKIGEKLNLKWNKYGKESQKIYFNTNFPYIFILPIGISAGFSLEKYEFDYLNTNINAAITYSLSFKNKIEFYFKRKQSLPINKDIETSNLKESKHNSWGIKFIYDATDYILNPRKGIYINATSGFGYRTLDTNKSQTTDFELNIAYYIQLGQISTIALLNQSAAMFSTADFYVNELYKIGGSDKLRGFNQKSIYASNYSIFSIEPHLLTGKNSSIYLFGDFAYYQSQSANTNIHDTPFSFGIGINIDTKVGIFRLSYALGKQFDNPIKFSNSKVHFGFAARF